MKSGIGPGIGLMNAGYFVRGDGMRYNDRNDYDELLRSLLAKYHLPGASVGISDEASSFYVNAGELDDGSPEPYQESSLFRVGCMVKLFCATQVMMLCDEGKVGLDSFLVDCIPGLLDAKADVLRKVTIGQLLTHSSGLIDLVLIDQVPVDVDNVVSVVGSLDQEELFVVVPGTQTSYSTIGYILLAKIVEAMRGVSWARDLDERVFRPLGIKCLQMNRDPGKCEYAGYGRIIGADTPSYQQTEIKVILPGIGGALALNVRDVMRFGRMHLDSGTTADGTRMLSEESVAAMRRLYRPLAGPSFDKKWFAVGWFRYDDGSYGFQADGMRNEFYIRIQPKESLCMALGANYSTARLLYMDLWNQITEFGVRPDFVRRVIRSSVPEFEDLVGDYNNGCYSYKVFVEEERLFMRVESNLLKEYQMDTPVLEMTHVSGGHFTVPPIGRFTDFYFLTLSEGDGISHMWDRLSLVAKVP